MSWNSSWPSLALKQSRDSLSELRAQVASTGIGDSSMLAQPARFLTIRSTGHIEFTFDQCIEHYAEAKSHPNIARYVTQHLYKGKSVKPSVLVARLREMNEDWANELHGHLKEDDEHLERELNFMVNKRNKIAHGQNHGLGTRKALDLCDVAIDVGDWLVKRMDPRE